MAVLSALCREGDRVLLPRNCHQSVVHGLVLSGATPVYLPVHFHPGLGLPGLLRTDDLRAFLDARVAPHGNQAAGSLAEYSTYSPLRPEQDHSPGSLNGEVADTSSRPAADLQEGVQRLLVLAHPNYYGLSGDLAEQVGLARQRGLTVLADEAHGSHFCACPLFPAPALTVGADFTVMGAHKTLGAFTQAAWLHCREGGAAALKVGRALRLLQTTSPSYLLMASLDVARHQLQRSGERWEETARLGMRLRQEISGIPGLHAPGEELLQVPGVCAYDPTRLVVNVSKLGITGFTAAKWLTEERCILVEMADLMNLVFILSPGDEGPVAEVLLKGLRALAATGGGQSTGEFGGNCGYDGTSIEAGPAYLPIPRQAMTPRQAFFAPSCVLPLEESAGRIAAETITPYPPGVPLICPGEVIDNTVLDCLDAWRRAGGSWPGMARGAIYVVDGS
jgi:arginine/lysine/ornithine decarboxylase